MRYFFKKKKQKLQKTENTESLPPATVGKRVDNEERLATMFTHATHADTFVRSQQLRYTPKEHVGNVFGAFRFKSIYLEEIQAPNACNPQFMCVWIHMCICAGEEGLKGKKLGWKFHNSSQ